jgi:ADP-ribosyl-[dinitrogen reductase] hydrolase
MNGDSSAYRLAVVGAGRVRGQIAMAGCPGRAAGMLLASNSAWRLQRDVATLKYWGAQALVTLLEKPELALMRLGELPAVAAAHHIAWYHIPLRDGHIPDERFELLWQGIAPRLRRVMWSGGRVAFHCGDGRSRTAMIAAKLLVELGCPAQDALNRVRGARPGVLLHPEEEEFVRAQVPAAEAAFGTHVSLVQPLTVGNAATRGEEPAPDSAPLPFDDPNQLDLLRTSQKD